ncbi:abortive infection protein, putative [hydrothermal vent metagenome]|uniref:Abortive infection protein, putative n=1 Tax=hydrothermal vent metagenome TaxID=652676 RepID=A0A1W1D407_9ZZZZ
MLIEFGGYNFFSFKEGFSISLQSKNKISSVLAIKGANASGKTNVIKVLSFLHSFVTNSFTLLQPDEEILVFSFFHNRDPIYLYVIFKYQDIEYKYELELTPHTIIRETIYKKHKRWSKIIERKGKKLTKVSEDFKELKTISLVRTNASIVSIAKQYGLKVIEEIYNLFQNIETNVNIFGRTPNEDNFPDYKTVTNLYYKNNNLLKFVINILKRADTGIENIKIKSIINSETTKEEYIPIFEYKVNNEMKTLTYHEQSNGVKSLYLQLGLYAIALDLGMVLALDEFDIDLHPDLIPMLVDLFENKASNQNNAQFIFTTHHTSIMDKLGKYKIVFVNKDENESYLYRLDEIPGDILRPDRSIIPVYKANKIGGKPRIDYGTV